MRKRKFKGFYRRFMGHWYDFMTEQRRPKISIGAQTGILIEGRI